MKNRKAAGALGVALLGAILWVGCDPKSGPGTAARVLEPRIMQIPLGEALPPGVMAALFLDYFPSASFDEITSFLPEAGFTGACVEGNSFSGKGDVYVVRLHVKNTTAGELRAPELHLRRPNPVVGAEDVVFSAPSKRVKAGQEGRFLYFWDPGVPVPAPAARLVWAR